MISAHRNLRLLGSGDSPASASWVDRTIGTHYHVQLVFVFLVETGFHHVGQAGLELLTSGDLPASPSQRAGVTGVSRCVQPAFSLLNAKPEPLLIAPGPINDFKDCNPVTPGALTAFIQPPPL